MILKILESTPIMKNITKFYGLLLLLIGSLSSFASGTIYFHTQFVPTNLWDGDQPEFSFYVPSDVNAIKGVYYYLEGAWGSSISVASDSVYQNLADKHNFIIMGCKMHPRMSREAHIWSAQASVDALDSLATLVGRPAIGALPFFLEGYSLGGQFAWHFTRIFPQRVIAYVTMKGGFHRTDPTNTLVRQVPSLWFKGEIDANYRKDNMDFIFRQERKDNDALMALLSHRGMGHERVLDTALIFQFFRSCTALRLQPQTSILSTLSSSSGYLMHQSNFAITGVPCTPFSAADHSWFPDSLVALEAQRFASQGTASLHTRCASGIGLNEINNELIISLYPNPVKDNLNLELSEASRLKIANLNGQVLKDIPLSAGSARLDLSELQSGTYLVIVQNETDQKVYRIVKE